MKVFLTSLFTISLSIVTFAQNPEPVPCENPIQGAVCHPGQDEPEDGNGSLGLSYTQTACGLNYVQASLMTTPRFTPAPGPGYPASLVISGIPCSATSTIEKAYLWWSGGGTANNPNYTFNGNPGVGTRIGTHGQKCWGTGGTESYRADVTALVPGNGTYTFSSPIGQNMDGVTLMVIYRDVTATYEGTIVLHDGMISNSNGGPTNATLAGLNVCANSTAGNAFVITGDMQNNVAPPTHTATLNGVPTVFPNLFYQFNVAPATFTMGQTTSAFGLQPTGGGDCYSWALMGVYYQTTTCTACIVPPSSLTATSVKTDASCNMCDGTATTTPVGGTGPYLYSWNTVPVQTTQTATGLCPGTYIVSITDASCLTASDTVTIGTQGGPPAPVVTAAGPFCTTDPIVTLSATPVGGTWSGTGITNATTGTFDPNVAGQGTHIISYQDSANCGGLTTINIVVNLISDATITPAGPFCPGDPALNLTAVDPGGTWSGTGITSAVNGTFSPFTAGPGTHTITYAIGGACGDTQTVNIVVNPYLDATITAAGPFCINDLPVTLTAGDPGGTWSGTGITNTATGTFDPAIAGAGTHAITYGIPGGCGDTNTINIVVNSLDNATITPAGPFCAENTPITLTAATAGGTWSGTGITNPTTGTFNPSIAGAGTHTITYVTGGNCSNTDTENIIVNPLPVVSFIADTLSLCVVPATPFQFANTSGGVGTSVLWDFGDGTNGYTDIESHSYANAGTYTVSLTVTSSVAAGSCSNTLTKNNYVTLHTNPTAAFIMEKNPVSLFDPRINFYDQSYTNIVAWDWNIGGLTTSALQNPSYIFPEDTGSYLVVLTVTDGFGCENTTTDIAIIKGEHAIYVPNAFTPDGDGVNDGFYPDGFGFSDRGYSFLIFDRWGEVIFESHKKFQPWNGTYKGKLVPNGTYVWQVTFNDLNGKNHVETGRVTVIK
jgi:gliding motility-associated-like protein